MSKFNTTIKKPVLNPNLAGGLSHGQSRELEMVSILLTSFVKDQFYRNSNDSIDRLKQILKEVDPLFAAKAAIFARDQFGMRSITHVLASELASSLSGKEWAKNFYDKIVVRLDDMTEILSYYVNNNTNKVNPKFPNTMKKGFAQAFERYNGYHIAKYRGENKQIKLVDVVNLVHPRPTDGNRDALSKLVNGTLRNTDTWESKLSQAGQDAENEVDLDQLKSEAWGDLISNKKIGYFAALRNLRNVLNQAPEFIDQLCGILTDEKMILSSRVLPFRFKTAHDEIISLPNTKESRKIMMSIDRALEISVQNVPKFEGETLVVIDVSKSMRGKASDIASLFGSVLAKANLCDVMIFDSIARYVSYNPSDSVLTIKNSFNFAGGATNFKDIFNVANKRYDRFIILSDMQGFVGHNTPKLELESYKKRFGCDPYIYSWDLAGYGTLQFPEKRVFALAGFSEKVLKIMNFLERGDQTLISEINKIEI